MSNGVMASHHFFTGRIKFNEGAYQEAHGAFERLVDQAEGLERQLMDALATLSVGFELVRRRRMLDAGYVRLHEAGEKLARIPLTELKGVELRPIKEAVQAWLVHLDELGTVRGRRPVAPRVPEI